MVTDTRMQQPPTAPPASLAEVIACEGGRVTFARFMQLALTHATLGYYSGVDRLLRHGGDFNTAPALSPFFNRTLARLVTELVDAALATCPAERPSVVELGGGEGHLAAGMFDFWNAERADLRERLAYRVVEVGARLRQRQAEALSAPAAGWDLGWGADLEEACAGTNPVVVLGNEFLDTLPVHVIEAKDGAVREAYVESAGGELAQTWGTPSGEATAELQLLFGTTDPRRLGALTGDGTIEVSPGLNDLLGQMATLMPAGSFITVDYGDWLPGVDAGTPHAQAGGSHSRGSRRRTVRGYFKHQLVSDILARPGKQDLTADVDFAAVDLHGRRHGFQTVLFTTLAAFLRAGGAEAELRALLSGTSATACDPLEADRQATVLRNLLDERDLGGTFKLMVQATE
jgi:SAM-dependent MidA family methyltransferase